MFHISDLTFLRNKHGWMDKKNAKKNLGEGDTPSPDPTPLSAYDASILAPVALKLNVTPPSPRTQS